MPIEVIGLDADDTLWESEVHFVDVEDRFRTMIARYDPSAWDMVGVLGIIEDAGEGRDVGRVEPNQPDLDFSGRG